MSATADPGIVLATILRAPVQAICNPISVGINVHRSTSTLSCTCLRSILGASILAIHYSVTIRIFVSNSTAAEPWSHFSWILWALVVAIWCAVTVQIGFRDAAPTRPWDCLGRVCRAVVSDLHVVPHTNHIVFNHHLLNVSTDSHDDHPRWLHCVVFHSTVRYAVKDQAFHSAAQNLHPACGLFSAKPEAHIFKHQILQDNSSRFRVGLINPFLQMRSNELSFGLRGRSA
mmetsp:Transcript_30476/g.64565  ORF Transcript_30476/g.64565 Transcript_30476/m.64565 type:complete len:230 (-) Transcript_30476:361-1050(-)